MEVDKDQIIADLRLTVSNLEFELKTKTDECNILTNKMATIKEKLESLQLVHELHPEASASEELDNKEEEVISSKVDDDENTEESIIQDEFNGSVDTQKVLETVFDAIADPIFVTLSSFRKLIKECKMLDSKVVAGDIDVAYSTSLKKKKEAVTSSTPINKRYKINNDNKLNIEQFRAALIFIANKKYKNNETDLWNEALDESYAQLKEVVYLDRLLSACIKPWGIQKGVLSEDIIEPPELDNDALRSPEVLSLFNKERSALQIIFDHYSKRTISSLSNSHPDARDLLDFSELMIFAREYNITPRLCSISRLIELFRSIMKNKKESLPLKINGRRSSVSSTSIDDLELSAEPDAGVKLERMRRGSSFSSDRSGRGSLLDFKGASVLTDSGGAEALTYPQFIELLGHIALESFSGKGHPLAEQRVLSLMQWLDTSKGRDKMATKRSSTVVRFGSRTGFK